MLVVALQLCLGHQVLHPGTNEALQPAQEAFDLPLSDEVARFVFGQAFEAGL